MDSNYYSAINQKLQNQNTVNIEKMDLFNKENEITQKLLNEYESKFNQKYDTNSVLNAQIGTREKLIDINQNSFESKINTILVIRYFLFLLFFLILLGIGKYLNFYSNQTLWSLLLLAFILYIVITYYRIYYDNYTLGEYRAIKFATDSTSNIFKEFASAILPDYITRHKCPKGCHRKGHLHPKHKVPIISDDDIKEMSTDSTLDNWKDGDILQRGCTVENNINNCPPALIDSPKPWYGQGDKYQTMYHCVNENGKEFVGYIPCQYFPNYKTKKTL